MEKANSTKTKKFYVGEELQFKLKDFPKTWRKETIVNIIPEENLLVFEDTYHKVTDFSMIRIERPWAKSIGLRLMQFSAALYVYGGLASLVPNEYKMSEREIVISGIFAGVGFLIRKLFSRKKFKLNKRRRLRIMDLRMSVP